MSCPTKTHVSKLKHVYRYLNGTTSRQMTLGGRGEAKLFGYADASFGNDPDTRRSTTGYAWFFGPGGAISWTSKTQKTVALSTTEAEFVALNEAARDGMFLRGLLKELGMEQTGPSIIYEDSTGAEALAKNPVHHSRTKHMDVKYHYIRELVRAEEIVVQHIHTDRQVADVLTKPLASGKFDVFTDILMEGHHEQHPKQNDQKNSALMAMIKEMRFTPDIRAMAVLE